MDFKNFCSKKIPPKEEIKQQAFENNKETVGNIKEQINKFQNKSESELMNEFFKASKSINLDDKKIDDITQKISPMLNEEQRQKMQQLLQQIRK